MGKTVLYKSSEKGSNFIKQQSSTGFKTLETELTEEASMPNYQPMTKNKNIASLNIGSPQMVKYQRKLPHSLYPITNEGQDGLKLIRKNLKGSNVF